jgi:hypothetical protein
MVSDADKRKARSPILYHIRLSRDVGLRVQREKRVLGFGFRVWVYACVESAKHGSLFGCSPSVSSISVAILPSPLTALHPLPSSLNPET